MSDRSAAEILALLLERGSWGQDTIIILGAKALEPEARRAVERERPAYGEPWPATGPEVSVDLRYVSPERALLLKIYEHGCPLVTRGPGGETWEDCAFCGEFNGIEGIRHAHNCIWLELEAASGPKP